MNIVSSWTGSLGEEISVAGPNSSPASGFESTWVPIDPESEPIATFVFRYRPLGMRRLLVFQATPLTPLDRSAAGPRNRTAPGRLSEPQQRSLAISGRRQAS